MGAWVPVNPGWARATSDWPVTDDCGLSAVIAHHGDPAIASRLVADLSEQDHTGSLEIIISDDASPIPFVEAPGVRVVRSPTNGGFGAAVNRGAAVANFPWLLVLNSDVRVAPSFVRRLLGEAMKWQPAICGVRQRCARGYQPPAMVYPTLGRTVAQSTSLPGRKRGGYPDRWSSHTGIELPEITEEVDWLVGSALLLPTALFRAVGGFDERYFMYLEEVDLQRRLHGMGVPSVLLADLELGHDAGQSSVGLEISVELLRSRLIYEEKWSGAARRRLLAGALRGLAVVDAASEPVRRLLGRPPTARGTLSRRLRTIAAASRSRTNTSLPR